MATLLHSKKAGIVGVIIDVIVAAIFILMAATFISDVLGGFVSCTGQIEDASKVVCLGNGDGKVVCADKDSGVEKFSCEAGSKWQARAASSLPKLEWLAPAQEGGLAASNIFFGLGDHFCAYDWKGENLWGFNACADLSDVAIPTGSDVNSDVVCFGNGGSHTFYCLNKETSEVKLKVHSDPDWGKVDAKSTPVLNKEGNTNYAYFGLGNRVCKYDVAKGDVHDAPNQAAWCQSQDHTIPAGVTYGGDNNFFCYSGGADHTVHCRNSDGGYGYAFHGGWSDCPATITKAQSGSSTYDVDAECKTSAAPVVSGNYVYIALGNRLCKYDLNSNVQGQKDNGAGALWCTNKIGTQSFALKFKPPFDQTVHWNSGYVTGGNEIDGYWKHFIYGEIKGVAVNNGFVCAVTDLEVVCLSDSDATSVFTGRISGLNVDKYPDLKVICSREACKSNGQSVLSDGNLYFALGDLLCSYPTSVFAAGKSVEISNEDDKSDGRNWCVDISDKQIQTGVAALPQLEIIETGPAYAIAGADGKADLVIHATTNIPASCRYDDAASTYDQMPDNTQTNNAVHTWDLPNTPVGVHIYNVACKSDKTPGEARNTIRVSVKQQDLSIKSFTISPNLGSKGAAATITAVISFSGINAVGPYSLKLLTWDPDGVAGELAAVNVPSQNPGQDITQTWSFTPQKTGTYKLEVAADFFDVVKGEASEANNQQTINWPVSLPPCADDATDLSLSNPMVEYKDGSNMNLNNFDPNKRFMAHIDLKTTNHNCINDAKVKLYAKAPWMPAEMDLGAQGVQWDKVSPDVTLSYPSDFGFPPPNDWAIFPRNPNTGQYDKGIYTLRFALTPIVATDPPAGNEYTITFTV